MTPRLRHPRILPASWLSVGLSLVLALLLIGAGSARAEIRVTDLSGREVVLEQPARRIVLGEGRHLAVLGMLHDDPVSLLAGWRQDKGLDPATFEAYLAKFPALADVAPVGAGNRLLSVESTIALMPDLVLLSLMDARDPQMEMPLRQLEAAGIPVAFVDFFTAPLENTLPSLRLIGQLTGAEAKAEEFAGFYRDHLDNIRLKLKAAQPAPPRVFIHVHAAPSNCCATVGPGVFDEFVEAAGGYNIGRDSVPGVMGNVGLENLLASDPDVYLATGGAHMKARGGLVLGAGIDDDVAAQSFADLLDTPGFADLRSVREGRAIGIWHLFNDFPAHIALIEALAKRFHPDLFPDLDPMATMAEFEDRFSPVEMTGSYWTPAE
ncbi:ABC transporter substrate-binding protein [Yangia mangrovi]|uniref:ABC transporter substrate-binding protein n=1 Tax=Alloyangia mangrovi TaxID=1779329 RepID=A0A2A3JQQ6_9RHOB|nr:ABC transporter substrate-binding protein [Alloyangia mangrovi]MCA0939976.1 ABC transporter substrate-binding protein [Alloyangia pacifica]MCA0948135.1 ABC transporter substrate-binding protein [Alloyangia pacifica]MCT4373362.1 ABC transporter substrate-binding protein [Alloyangia mangrovi]